MTRNYNAFTLAEVLITLVIIGIIAAMTIPTLINKTQNQEFVSRLKKTYSTLSQATQKIIAEEGTPRATVGGWAGTSNSILEQYKKHLSKSRICTPDEGSCFENITYKAYNGNTAHASAQKIDVAEGRLILSDGAFVNLYNYNTDCAGGQGADGEGQGKICFYIHVDTNGAKGPNRWGRDAFRFYVTERGMYPTGCEYNQNNCADTNNSAAGTGIACTCAALRDSAMNY